MKLESLLTEVTLSTRDPSESAEKTETEGIHEEEGEKWVQAVEHVCQLLPRALPFLVAKNGIGKCRLQNAVAATTIVNTVVIYSSNPTTKSS